MPLQKVELQIDGRSVQIVQFAAIRGMGIKARVYKLLLPAVGALLGGDSQVGSPPQSSLSKLADNLDLESAFLKLSESLEPEAFTKLMLDLLSSTFVDGRMIDSKYFDELFAGNYMMAYKLAIEVIKANGFFEFGAIGPLLEKTGLMGQPTSSKE